MSQEDLSALVKQLYDQSCAVFGEKFHMEYAVKKRDMEIHNLEMETSESHGTFKIPKLKKVIDDDNQDGLHVIFSSFFKNFGSIISKVTVVVLATVKIF